MDFDLATALDRQLTPDARQWLTEAVTSVGQDPTAVRGAFPAVARRCGRGPLAAGWTVADAARARLLQALPLRGADLAAEIADLHRYGDAAEQRAVLRSLALLEDADPTFADLGLPLVHSALRGNDTGLIEAALGPYAARHLDPDGYRHAVLKCVFCGIPLDRVAGLTERADRELARMLADFAHERVAAGRAVPADVWPILRDHPGTLEASGLPAEADSPSPDRRAAAAQALAAFNGAA
ncbi:MULTISPECIES: EboA domain-containing protein [unclassified Streptomyces]|uniref:EboA domain-containing protein n=1 Tax=unclassified Streptomyces TaxID=2593676 RepID=UPI0036EC5DEC